MNFLRVSQPTLTEQVWTTVKYPVHLLRNPLDIFTSVPALSFLIIPTFSSYTTSLNLLFFYLTWSTLILSNPPLKIEVIGTLAIRILFYILPSLGFLAFDGGVPTTATKLKEHGDVALPLGEEQGGKKGRWWKIALVSVGNVLLGVAVQAGIELLFTQVLHIRSALKVTTSVPMPWTIGIDLIRGLLLREVSWNDHATSSMFLSLISLSRQDSNLYAASLCAARSQFTPPQIPHVMATLPASTIRVGCELRPSSPLSRPRLPSHLPPRAPVQVSPPDIPYVPHHCIIGRDICP